MKTTTYNTDKNLDTYYVVRDTFHPLEDLIERLKKELGCKYIYVDRTYNSSRLFPIYNQGQKDFIISIFEKGERSRFDNLIHEVLESKESDLEKMLSHYDNLIDFLD